MNKKIMTLAMALVFAVASVGVAYSFTCEVTAVDGENVTLKCKEKYAKKLTVGGKAKVSAKGERKAVEGC